MKIAFFGGNLLPLHANTLKERALGGTETALIRLSEHLHHLGHEVTVFTSLDNPPASKPVYKHLSQVESHSPVDFFISVRDWIPCFYRISSKKRLFWTGDSYDQFSNYGLGDKRVNKQIDRFLAVSQWQANEICERSGFPLDKTLILRNGIELGQFEKKERKVRKRLIYSSTPYRGLQFVPALYQILKDKHPELELHVFSSYKIYDQDDSSFVQLRDQLSKLKDCTVHPNVLQSQLATEFLKSSILFYPCIFEETSCITAMEAMAAGCVPLSSQLGALPETIGSGGILVPGLPTDENYLREFLNQCDRLLSDDSFFEETSAKALARSQYFSWQRIAEEFSKNLETLL